MPLHDLLPVLSLVLHSLGLILCLVGLTLARGRHRPLGYGLAALGFLIAASPMLAQLAGLVPPPPAAAALPVG